MGMPFFLSFGVAVPCVDAYRLRYLASFVASARRIANIPQQVADDIHDFRRDYTLDTLSPLCYT